MKKDIKSIIPTQQSATSSELSPTDIEAGVSEFLNGNALALLALIQRVNIEQQKQIFASAIKEICRNGSLTTHKRKTQLTTLFQQDLSITGSGESYPILRQLIEDWFLSSERSERNALTALMGSLSQEILIRLSESSDDILTFSANTLFLTIRKEIGNYHQVLNRYAMRPENKDLHNSLDNDDTIHADKNRVLTRIDTLLGHIFDMDDLTNSHEDACQALYSLMAKNSDDESEPGYVLQFIRGMSRQGFDNAQVFLEEVESQITRDNEDLAGDEFDEEDNDDDYDEYE